MKLIFVILGELVASAAHAQNAPWCLQPSGDQSLHCVYATLSGRSLGEWFLHSKLHIPAFRALHSAALG